VRFVESGFSWKVMRRGDGKLILKMERDSQLLKLLRGCRTLSVELVGLEQRSRWRTKNDRGENWANSNQETRGLN